MARAGGQYAIKAKKGRCIPNLLGALITQTGINFVDTPSASMASRSASLKSPLRAHEYSVQARA